jgi:hypothetical protein
MMFQVQVLGGVLMQDQKPIAFISQALQGRNLAMSTYDKEMLALVLAIQKWRPYLMGRKFIVRTNHKSLKYLWEQKITTIAQQRWLSKLMGYDFVIEYKRGSENLVADALSCREDTRELKAISQPVPSWMNPSKKKSKQYPNCRGSLGYVKKVKQWVLGNSVKGSFSLKIEFICEKSLL